LNTQQQKENSRLKSYKQNNSIISQSGRNAINNLSIVTAGPTSGTTQVETQKSLPQINSMKNIREIEGNLSSKNKGAIH
jgi:hypothetical protein